MQIRYIINQFILSVQDIIDERYYGMKDIDEFIENSEIYKVLPIKEVETVANKIKGFPYFKTHFGITSIRYRLYSDDIMRKELHQKKEKYITDMSCKSRSYKKDNIRRMDVTSHIYFAHKSEQGNMCELIVRSYMQIPDATAKKHDKTMIECCNVFSNGILKVVMKSLYTPNLEVPVNITATGIPEKEKSFDGYFQNTGNKTKYMDSEQNPIQIIDVNEEELKEKGRVVTYETLKEKITEKMFQKININ